MALGRSRPEEARVFVYVNRRGSVFRVLELLYLEHNNNQRLATKALGFLTLFLLLLATDSPSFLEA